jgi:hypothetical protein
VTNPRLRRDHKIGRDTCVVHRDSTHTRRDAKVLRSEHRRELLREHFKERASYPPLLRHALEAVLVWRDDAHAERRVSTLRGSTPNCTFPNFEISHFDRRNVNASGAAFDTTPAGGASSESIRCALLLRESARLAAIARCGSAIACRFRTPLPLSLTQPRFIPSRRSIAELREPQQRA